MRRPVLTGGSVLALLLVLGLPFLGVQFGLPDHRVLPEIRSSRQVQEVIDREFVRGEGNSIVIIAPGGPVVTDRWMGCRVPGGGRRGGAPRRRRWGRSGMAPGCGRRASSALRDTMQACRPNPWNPPLGCAS
jgi:hypothetical protein